MTLVLDWLTVSKYAQRFQIYFLADNMFRSIQELLSARGDIQPYLIGGDSPRFRNSICG